MRRILFILGLLVLALIAGAWYWWVQSKTAETLKQAASKAAEVGLEGGGLDVDLSLKGITLSHGEKGEMHWQLTAEGAQYVQDAGTVQVERPTIVYKVADSGEELTVHAPLGSIYQGEEKAKLWPEVNATYQDNKLSAGELLYDGKERIIHLSGGVRLEGPKFKAQTSRLRFNLPRDEIVAEAGVNATVYVAPWFDEEKVKQ